MITRFRLLLAMVLLGLLLWGWLWAAGTVMVVDRSGAVAQASIVESRGVRPLHRLPGGVFVGIPHADGHVRIACRDGTSRDYGYVTPAMHVWLKVSRGGRCGRIEKMR